tara:strand:- start:468 stop:614 length:147 start_codon:yes stop_codon:yes gene_type:complete
MSSIRKKPIKELRVKKSKSKSPMEIKEKRAYFVFLILEKNDIKLKVPF